MKVLQRLTEKNPRISVKISLSRKHLKLNRWRKKLPWSFTYLTKAETSQKWGSINSLVRIGIFPGETKGKPTINLFKEFHGYDGKTTCTCKNKHCKPSWLLFVLLKTHLSSLKKLFVLCREAFPPKSLCPTGLGVWVPNLTTHLS